MCDSCLLKRLIIFICIDFKKLYKIIIFGTLFALRVIEIILRIGEFLINLKFDREYKICHPN
jgi:hypothetical protein